VQRWVDRSGLNRIHDHVVYCAKAGPANYDDRTATRRTGGWAATGQRELSRARLGGCRLR
jgi:hypothetical protein